MKSPIIYATIMFAILVLVPTQVYAYTIIEFAVADPPTTYNNVTFTIEDQRLNEEYVWLQFSADVPKDGLCCYAKYASLPDGVAEAWDDPQVQAEEFEPNRALDEGGWFTAINRTIEPGTPLKMCVSYDNNEKCEYTAVRDEGEYSVAILQVDVDAAKPPKFKGAS